jgi:hypothetical protein
MCCSGRVQQVQQLRGIVKIRANRGGRHVAGLRRNRTPETGSWSGY